MSTINNFSKVDGFQDVQAQVEGAVPAQLLVELAQQFYADREADRAMARDIIGQMMALGVQVLELAKAEQAERAEQREAAERQVRRERHDERMRNERNARR